MSAQSKLNLGVICLPLSIYGASRAPFFKTSQIYFGKQDLMDWPQIMNEITRCCPALNASKPAFYNFFHWKSEISGL